MAENKVHGAHKHSRVRKKWQKTKCTVRISIHVYARNGRKYSHLHIHRLHTNCKVGQNHVYIHIYGACKVYFAVVSSNIRSYKAYIYGFGQPYVYTVCAQYF